MKLYKKVGLGIAGLALAVGTYYCFNEQKTINHGNTQIEQTLESKLQETPQKPKAYKLTKEQKDALGYIVKIAEVVEYTKKENHEENEIIADKNKSSEELNDIFAEKCNDRCLIYQDSDGNYRISKGVGSVYSNGSCYGKFIGQGWVLFGEDGQIEKGGVNKSDKSDIKAEELFDYGKCD